MICIKCKKEATIRLSPDIDIKGISVCEDCKMEVKQDLILSTMGEFGLDYFNKKYGL